MKVLIFWLVVLVIVGASGYVVPILLFGYGWRDWGLKTRTFLIKTYLRLVHPEVYPLLLDYEKARGENIKALRLVEKPFVRDKKQAEIAWKGLGETNEECKRRFKKAAAHLPAWTLAGMCYYH